MRPVALFWPYNDAQYHCMLRVIDGYFSRSAPKRPGSGRGCSFLRIRRLPVQCRFGVKTSDAGPGPYHYASGNLAAGDAKVGTNS
jgi:hypothetical protein